MSKVVITLEKEDGESGTTCRIAFDPDPSEGTITQEEAKALPTHRLGIRVWQQILALADEINGKPVSPSTKTIN